jgi:hypothetical protein
MNIGTKKQIEHKIVEARRLLDEAQERGTSEILKSYIEELEHRLRGSASRLDWRPRRRRTTGDRGNGGEATQIEAWGHLIGVGLIIG